MSELRKYGILLTAAKAIQFTLYQVDGVDIEPAATFAAGDIKISKDGGAEANTTNLPTDEGQGYRLILTAAELTASRIRLFIVDQTATKVWLDVEINIETHGHASAMFVTDFDEVMRGTDIAATATALATAQTDLDTITGADGVTLATTQGLYTPSKAGDSMDILSISGDTTAADNLELQYDTTGLIGDTFPATQAALGNLSTGSSAISKRATSGTVTVGTVVGGTTYTNTYTLDGIFHSITEDGLGNFDVQYNFDVGGNGIGSEIVMDGYLSGNGDVLQVQAYNWVGATWENIGTVVAASGTEVGESRFVLDVQHTGTSANIGEIQIRGYEAAGGLSSIQLNMDRVRLDYAIVAQSVGYDGGQVWIDTIHGTAGVETYVNGVADNPALTLADAITIASNLSLHQFLVSNDSTITFGESHTDEVWSSNGGTLALGGQDVSNGHFYHFNDISGTGICASGEAHLVDSHIADSGACTLGQGHITRCSIGAGGLVLSQATNYTIDDCTSGIAGATAPIIDMGVAVGATNLSVRKWSGGLTLNNLALGDVVTLEGVFGTITLNGADAQVEIRGIAKQVVNNLTGSPTVNDDTIKADDIALISVDTTDMQSKLGTPSVDISADIDVINTAVAGVQTDLSNGTDGLGALKVLIDDVKVDTASGGIPKNAIFNDFQFPMVLTSDHYTAATAKTVTGQRSLNGGAWTNVTGSITEVGSGLYTIDLTAADTNGDTVSYKFSATSCDDTIVPTVITRS